ncbi:fibronectin type III domain-containing protein [Actinacidiphila glaucinigra]|uniref:fibronectin type III domain-containing protein n=1 Tax=Actinacidiphila glaucinigra TaxID=235986 RepID=UPI0035E2E1F4
MFMRIRAAQAAAMTVTVGATCLVLPAGAAHAATTCSTGVWVASYYANTTFKGTPKKTTCDTSINENYGTGDPTGVTLPKDNFGVRWNLTRDFGSGGPFTLTAATRDGIRVYLDGTRKIDLWKDVTTTRTKTLNLTIPKGKHTLRVDYAAFKGSANVKFTYTPRTSASVDKTKPLAPAGLKAVYSTGTYKATLTWARNPEADLAGYRVYRRTGSGAWTRISGTAAVTRTSYTDAPAPTGDAYTYAVTAVDKAGNASGRSAGATVTSADRTGPAAPGAFTAASGAAGNTLRWTASAGATRYEIQRAILPGTAFTTTATTGATKYEDTSAVLEQSYAYRVRALDAAGNASAFTASAEATRDSTAPPVPTGLTVAAETTDGVSLTWTGGGGDTAGYRVYRAASANGARTLIGSPQRAAYADLTGDPGRPYWYQVAAVDAAGNESARTTAVSAAQTAGPDDAPAAPTITSSFRGTTLSMVFRTDGYVPADHYVVYRSRTTPVRPEDGAELVAGSSGLQLILTGVTDRDYHYAVVAVSRAGAASGYSADHLPVWQPVGLRPTEIYETSQGDGTATLRWAAAAGEPGLTVDGYRVYRSTSPGVTKETATKVTSLPGGDDQFTDTGLDNGVTYYYAVSVVYNQGESGLSPEVALTPHS